MQLSVWEKEAFFGTQDIVIIGSGLVGLWTALELKTRRPSLRLTLLERGPLPYGASTRNAGFACFGSPSELMHDLARFGEDRMWSLVEMRYRGIEKMVTALPPGTIGFERSGGYEVFMAGATGGQLDEHLDFLNQGLEKITGTSRCFLRADAALQEFGFAGFGTMVANRLEGLVHSGKLVKQLLSMLQALGVQVFTGMEVVNWEKINGQVTVFTKQGLTFTCEQVLISTNAFTSTLLPGTAIKPGRGQVILSSPVAGLRFRGSFHFDEGFYYFRNLGERVLLGGARNLDFEAEATTEMGTTEVIQQRLEEFLSQHLLPGQAFSIEQRWSGIMGFSDDKQPLIKRIDDQVSVAFSCNGMGVALAPVVATRVADLLLNEGGPLL